jgi:hypothetical protein
MTNVAHGVRAFSHVRQETIGESAKLRDRAIEPFLLVRSFYELGMLHGASSDGIDDGQLCWRAEVYSQGRGYMMVCCVCTWALGRGMATDKSEEIDRVLVDVHRHVTCAAAGGECTDVSSLAGHNLVAVAFQPSCGCIIFCEKSFAD